MHEYYYFRNSTGNISMVRIFPLILITLLTINQAKSQDRTYFVKAYSDSLVPKRILSVVGGQAFIYGSSLALLYQAWYKDYPRTSFQFFNDNTEWLQMDKVGHATTAAYFGKFGYEMYRWAGIKRNKAILIGGSTGFIFLTVIEMLDAYSAQWGASWGDFVANAAGSGLFIGQQFAWDDQRFNLKFSYHQTEFAKYRPDQLGDNFFESMVKDYNGQSYWLSGNVKSFLPKQSRFPYWLNVSVGYSGEGMLGAKMNPSKFEGKPLPQYTRYRQYFLSLDVDLARIKTKSHFVKFLLNGFNFIKIPFPALEYNQVEGLRFHPVYY